MGLSGVHMPGVSDKYPAFVPTFKFQELHDWQQVPVGCITEMNLSTCKKYCKLDPNYLIDPEYGIPACLRRKTHKDTVPQAGYKGTPLIKYFLEYQLRYLGGERSSGPGHSGMQGQQPSELGKHSLVQVGCHFLLICI